MAKIVHISGDEAGYRRKRRGKGFEYLDHQGKPIRDKEELARIIGLRIPPAWKDVWICANPEGHLQATGIDARGRKQYLYHEEWNRRSLANKFDRMAGFAKALPEIRKRIQSDLRKEGWPREKVISLVIMILDQCALRIGNKAYEQENGTYGITTLRRSHLKINGNYISFQFKAKGGIYRNTLIKGKRLTRLIRECSEIPGQEVFQYLDKEGNRHPVFSHDVNSYLQQISGGDYTAKDFRTWSGTVGGIELIPSALKVLEAKPKWNLTKSLINQVAEKLGNTAAVCKAYYIHPAILAIVEDKEHDMEKLIAKANTAYPDMKGQLTDMELAALYLIEHN
jgi:DNA topoisomerase-1